MQVEVENDCNCAQIATLASHLVCPSVCHVWKDHGHSLILLLIECSRSRILLFGQLSQPVPITAGTLLPCLGNHFNIFPVERGGTCAWDLGIYV